MVQQLKDDLLHKRTRHTNQHIPYSKHISVDNFPAQNTELLDTIVPMGYRNLSVVEPSELIGPEKDEPYYIYYQGFRVVRCDSVEPYVMIGISLDYKLILVTDSRCYLEKISIYPIQFNEFSGIELRDQYVADQRAIKAITLRVDNGEPCNSVIVEYLEDDKVRFVLGDECFSKLIDYFGAYEDNDYDGRDPIEYAEEFIDVDGSGVSDENVIQFVSIDGGYPDPLKDIYVMHRTDEEIVAIRKLALKGKTIYGAS